MKNIEITCEVFNDISEIKLILEKYNFKYIEEFVLDDIYFYNIKTGEFGIQKGKLSDTLIIRNTNAKDKEIIIKKRKYDKNGFEIETEKQSYKINDIKKEEAKLKSLGYDKFLRMIDKNYKYENKEYIIFIQEVDGLGVFLEIESKNSEDSEFQIKKMIRLVKSFDLNIGTKFDIRKAELLYRKQQNY